MKIMENVYALDSTGGSYCYIIRNGETILIDTCFPGKGKAILAELKSMGIEPADVKHIFITHNDIDHIGNASMLQKATNALLWASKEDIPYINGEIKRPGTKKILSTLIKIEVPEKLNPYPENQKIGDIQIIPTPGHTPGHVCLLYRNVLFAGDLVVGSKGKLMPSPWFMTWNKNILRESIEKMAGYSFKWVCPAHGKPIERGDLWEKIYKQ